MRVRLLFVLLALGAGCLSTPDPRPQPDGWLRVEDGRIRTSDGRVFHGRGASLNDTRGCDACAWNTPNPGEVERRFDELVDVWGANFVQLALESYASDGGGRLHWQNVLDDADYLADLQRIVQHARGKPGVYVVLSLWLDPSFTSDGWPTQETRAVWARLAEAFAFAPNVLYGVALTPEAAADGSQDALLWDELNETVATIRAVEDAARAPHHVILVPAMIGGSGLDYYRTRPITAGNGLNIAYAVTVGGPPASFEDAFVEPSATLPVVVSLFNPSGSMTIDDCAAMMASAEEHEVPYLAWVFHMRCNPSLLVDNSGGGCGVGMTLEPTAPWGQLLKTRLASPW